MLDTSGINYWAVLVVWLIYMGVGAYWYSTKGFAKQWTKHTGIDILKIPTVQANRIIASVAASSLLQSFALAVVLNSLNPPDVDRRCRSRRCNMAWLYCRDNRRRNTL